MTYLIPRLYTLFDFLLFEVTLSPLSHHGFTLMVWLRCFAREALIGGPQHKLRLRDADSNVRCPPSCPRLCSRSTIPDQSRLKNAQHAALEHQMEEEKRSREGKLRDRLAKKRKAKEAEMQQAALSERVSGPGQRRIDRRLTTQITSYAAKLDRALRWCHQPRMQRGMIPQTGVTSNDRQKNKWHKCYFCAEATALLRRCLAESSTATWHPSHNLTCDNTCPPLNLLQLQQEKQAAQKHLEEEERAERQRFHDQVRIWKG